MVLSMLFSQCHLLSMSVCPSVCLVLSLSLSVTNGRHELVPKDIREEAEKYAKV